MKSLTKTRSFLPSVLNAESNSGSVYAATVKLCNGPVPLASHMTRTFNCSDNETIFSADKDGFSSLSHFRTTCGDTPTRFAKTSVSVMPAANIAARSRTPNLVIFSRKVITDNHLFLTGQDCEKKISQFLTFIKFRFAKTARVTFLPVEPRFIPTGSGRLCGDDFFIHFSSVPFFKQSLRGNSTINEGLFK